MECEPVDVVEADDVVILESEDNVAEVSVEAEPEIVEVEPIVEGNVRSVEGEHTEEA